uniref:RNA1 polyprotein n=1 Tax=Begonia plebeja nepovirus TaxID=3115757 RepID=A0AAT9JAX6_9SECO
MAYHCPVSSCPGFNYQVSRAMMREDGDRCPLACCGALLVKRVVAAPLHKAVPVTATVTRNAPAKRVAAAAPPPVVYQGCENLGPDTYVNRVGVTAAAHAAKLAAAKAYALFLREEEAMEAACLQFRARTEAEEKRAIALKRKAAAEAAYKRRCAKRATAAAAAAIQQRVAANRAILARKIKEARRAKAARAAKIAAAAARAEARAQAGPTKKALLRRQLKRAASSKRSPTRCVKRTKTAAVPVKTERAPIKVPYVCPLGTPIGRSAADFLVACDATTPRSRPVERISCPRRTRSSSPPPRTQGECESNLYELSAPLRALSLLDLPSQVKELFISSPDWADSMAHFEAILCLARNVCKYYARFPLPCYFGELTTLLNDRSIKNIVQLSSGILRELERLDQVFKNDQIADGMLAFTSGIIVGVGATVSGLTNSVTSSAKKVIDHAEAAFSRCANSLVDIVGQATQKFGDTLLDIVYQQFAKCLSPFLSALTHSRVLIENYWSAVRAWVKKMWGALPLEVQSLFESTWWALAIVVVAGLVTLTEKLLQALGMVSSVGPITNLFISGILVYLGFNIFDSDSGGAASILLETVRALVYTVLRGKPAVSMEGDLGANAPNSLDFPLRVLEVLGNGLISAPLGTLTHLGKYGAAMDQIRKGKDCIKEFLGFVTDRLADAWDHISGRKDSFFREIAAMTKVNITKWITKAQKVVLEAQTIAVTDAVLLDTTTHLIHEGHVLTSTLAGATRSTSLDYGRVISSLLSELMKVRAACARAGVSEGRRCEPFWAYIYGPSHCGKSLFMEEVTRSLLIANGHAPKDIFAKNARDSFWSGYMRQAAVQIDDLSACVTEPSVESEFLQLIGSKEYKLNMAAVEDKGMIFDSPIFVTSSNVFTAPTDAKILDKAAYNNRRRAVIQCRRAEGVEFDPRNPSLSCEARLVHPNDESPLGEWANCTKVLEEVVALNVAHRNKELILMSNYRERTCAVHPVYHESKQFLKTCTKLMRFGDITCDGKRYTVCPEQMVATPILKESAHGHEDVCINTVNDFTSEIQPDARMGMLRTFLYSLVEGPCEVESVEKLSDCATDGQRTFFLELPLLERIYLRLVQKRLHNVRATPDFCFKFDIKARILKSLSVGYKVVCDNGGKLLTIVAALAFILVLYSSFFLLYTSFFQGTQSGVAAIVTMSALSANAGSVSSVYSSSSGGTNYSTRNIPIQYRNVRGSDFGANAGSTDDFLMSALIWLELPGGGLVSALRGKGRFIYLTKHQAEAIPDGARVECVTRLKDGSARAVRTIWNSQKIQSYSGTEAVTYHDAVFSTLPIPAHSIYDVDIDALPTLFDMNVVVVKRKSTLREVCPSLQMLPAEQPIIDRWTSQGKICREMQGFNTFAYGGTYRNEIPISIVSKCPTYAEDCGAILTTMWKGQRRVIGLHVASGYKNGSSKDWTSTATLLPTCTDLECNSGLNMVEEGGVEEVGYRKIGYIPKISDRPYIAGRTMFVAVPDELCYQPTNLVETFSDGSENKLVVEIKQPAILTKDDPRIPPGVIYDPLKNGMEKFKQPMELIDDTLCGEIVSDMVDTWRDCFEALEDVSDEVAINGAEDEFFDCFNMQTSEGYPWVKQRGIGDSGKRRYFQEASNGALELKPDTPVFTAYNDLQKLSETQIPELICIETPKDECLPLRKITSKPKTRLFSILPLEYNLLLRKKFLSFAAALQSNRDKLPTQVGVNPYSREWGHIYARLREKNSVAINCDYSSFDGLLTAQILGHIGRAINCLYKDSDRSKTQRHNLLMAIVNRKSICGSQVYEVSAGLPSGCALTVLLNSVFNEILIRYVWKTCVGGIPRQMFSKYVCLIVYGDDNLISVHPDFLPSFNGMKIQSVLKAVGVTITDGSDKLAEGIYEKPFERLDFLKRRFSKQSDGTVLAPLDAASIFTCLQNVTLGAGSIPEAVKMNVHSALIELYLHQNRSWFDDLRTYYVKSQGWNDLPTWAVAHAFHREHLTGALPWAPHRLLDVPLDREQLVRAMSNQGEAQFCAQVAERIFVCGPRYTTKEEGHFVVSHHGSLKRGEQGVLAPVDFNSEGQGRLPTQLWVKKFRSSTHHTTALIRDAYGRGCNIYFRAEAPYIANWVSATSFAMGLGMDFKAILNLYHNVCTPDAQCLYEYFEERRFKVVKKYVAPSLRNRNF